MSGPSGSAHFQARFESALQAYQTTTGITLVEHALAVQLQSCNTGESIATLVQGQAQVFSSFSNYRESDRIMKSIKNIVSILTPLSVAAPLPDAVGLVRQIAVVVRFTSLTFFAAVPTRKGNTGWSHHLT